MATLKKVLVLGVTGMLGSTVFEYFKELGIYETKGTSRKENDLSEDVFFFDATNSVQNQLTRITNEFDPDYIINCIGIINKYCNDNSPENVQSAIVINSLFPYLISDYFLKNRPNTRIIQIATDCVFSGRVGDYLETDTHDALDVYGKTKSLGEVNNSNILNLRASIIGREKYNKTSLLEWFLGNKSGATILGFHNHTWNGITTLQFAQIADKIINEHLFDKWKNMNHVIHYCPNKSVSKYELLKIFQEVFKTDFVIKKDDNIDNTKYMTLKSKFIKFPKIEMIEAVSEYKKFLDK